MDTGKDKKALLIIDMQKGSFVPATPRYNAQNLISKINDLTGYFRKESCPVIFIQHDGSKENAFIPGTEEWEILSELDSAESDVVISKTANDAFYRTELSGYLKKQHIRRLWIVGCATDFCVAATIQSALNKDYHVVIPKNGHTTADRPHLKAKEIIAHYNWVWRNLIPTKGFVEVVDDEF